MFCYLDFFVTYLPVDMSKKYRSTVRSERYTLAESKKGH